MVIAGPRISCLFSGQGCWEQLPAPEEWEWCGQRAGVARAAQLYEPHAWMEHGEWPPFSVLCDKRLDTNVSCPWLPSYSNSEMFQPIPFTCFLCQRISLFLPVWASWLLVWTSDLGRSMEVSESSEGLAWQGRWSRPTFTTCSCSVCSSTCCQSQQPEDFRWFSDTTGPVSWFSPMGVTLPGGELQSLERKLWSSEN